MQAGFLRGMLSWRSEVSRLQTSRAAVQRAEADTRSTVPVTVSSELSQDLPDHASQAAYFVVSEALANLNKHSGATAAGVEARIVDGALYVRIYDNGIGGASTAKGHGLAGLTERLDGVDGRLTVTSPTGGPTTVEAMIPCTF